MERIPRRRRRRDNTASLYLAAVILFSILSEAFASNWAQVSGASRQNTVASAPSPWSRRWGFAFTVVDYIPEMTIDGMKQAPSKMYVMGGDDWVIDAVSAKRTNVVYNDYEGRARDVNYDRTSSTAAPLTGAGDYLNDVWYSFGADWLILADFRNGNGFNEPSPRITSQANWTITKPWTGVPSDVDGWREYLACCHESKMFPCRDMQMCVDGDPYKVSRRWSPRRGHQAVTVYDPSGTKAPTIVVMGGRARSHERMTGNELAGGFIGDPFDRNGVLRERSMLVSDVWTSEDGESWDFSNGGCYVPQLEHALAPGSIAQRCQTDYDCWRAGLGDAACVDGSTPNLPNRKMCVCRHWSPRERFAVASQDGKIYLSGGIMYHQQFLCGDFSCGTESGTYLDDVWLSNDLGKTWKLLIEHALTRDAYGRADHALLHSNGRWWMFGGKGREENDQAIIADKFFHNSYASQEGEFWDMNVSVSAWSPRAAFTAVADAKGVMYLLGGEEEYPVIDPKSIIFTAAEAVDRAAAKAPTNVDRGIKTAEAIDYPGETVNLMQVITVDESWVYYPDIPALEGHPFYEAWGPKIWFPDFGDIQTIQHDYVWPDMPLAHSFFNESSEVLGALEKGGLTTIQQLSDVSNELLNAYLAELAPNRPDDIPPPLANICRLRERARFLVSKCSMAYRPYDIEGYRMSPFSDFPVFLEVDSGSGSMCDGRDTGVDYSKNDVVCRQRYSPRRSFGAAIMTGRLYVVGGWEAVGSLANDVWYRDEIIPVTRLDHVPRDGSSESMFDFNASEPSCVYEIRVHDEVSGTMLRNWTKVITPYDGISLNQPNKATRVEVRAVDPAGNRDQVLTVGRNVYVWTYVPPFPLLAVVLGALFGLIVLIVGLLMYRRYQQKKALERYMAKRLARKLKQQQADAAEEKASKVKKKKKKKKTGPEKKMATTDQDMVSRFKVLLRNRAENRVMAEFNLLSKRKSAKETFAAESETRLGSRGLPGQGGPSAEEVYAKESAQGRKKLLESAEARKFSQQAAASEEEEPSRGARGRIEQDAVTRVSRESSLDVEMSRVRSSQLAQKVGVTGLKGMGSLGPARAYGDATEAGQDSDASLPGVVKQDRSVGGLPGASAGLQPRASSREAWAPTGATAGKLPPLGGGARAARAPVGSDPGQSEDDIPGKSMPGTV